MKLNDIRPNIETSGQLEEQFFSIQDQGMIFDILRNKMYSNPILAICREISCNARDAHREVGKSDIPIEICLPSNLDQNYKVRDFGPGISPDRMSNIFIKYTASTKRDDNTQTGGFGLGAKTPFSYSDTFNIKTNYNGIQYNYVCFIDETKVGKLALLSELPTTESNETEILIPVKPADFKNFCQWTEFTTRHWDVRPIIKGGAITWQDNKKILEGSNWNITASSDYSRSAKLIIDGIEYPLDTTALRTYADAKLIDASMGNLYLYFGVGELSLSANREQVYLDPPTKDKISKRISAILSEIKQTSQTKIDKFPDLWQANVFYRRELSKCFHNIDILFGTFYWNGVKLYNGHISVACTVYTFVKGKSSWRCKNPDPNKLSRSIGQSISFEENSSLFVNDLGIKDPTGKHVRKAFDDDLTLHSIQVICPNDKTTLDSLNKSIDLDKMIPRMLSSITKASSRAHTLASSRLLVFKYNAQALEFRQVSYASIDEDTNDKVFCTLTKDFECRVITLKNKSTLSLDCMQYIQGKFPKVSFYGTDSDIPQSRIDKEFSDFMNIEDFIKSKIIDDKNTDYIKIKFAHENAHHIDEKSLRYLSKVDNLIEDKKSFFRQHGELQKKIKSILASEKGLLKIYESIKGTIKEPQLKSFIKDNPEFDLEKSKMQYKKTYPLIEYISVYDLINVADPLAQYINLIDKV